MKSKKKYTRKDTEALARKIEQLGLWDIAEAHNWAIKPRGSVFPYFCIFMRERGADCRMRLFLLEGWQTMHDWVCLRMDPDYSCYLSTSELPSFEVAYVKKGILVVRHDPAVFPWLVSPMQNDLVGKMLWQVYGVMLRLEADHSLPLKYASERALFSRVELESGEWIDEPLPIPKPPPYVEKIDIDASLVKQAKALPIDDKLRVAVDVRAQFEEDSPNTRPHLYYAMRGIELSTQEMIFNNEARVKPAMGGSLKLLWLQMPASLLGYFIKLGRLPCEIQVVSGRVFRFLRPVFLNLSVKLSKLEEIPGLEKCFKQA